MGSKSKRKEKEFYSKEFLEAIREYNKNLEDLRKTFFEGMKKLEKHVDEMSEKIEEISKLFGKLSNLLKK